MVRTENGSTVVVEVAKGRLENAGVVVFKMRLGCEGVERIGGRGILESCLLFATSSTREMMMLAVS
jgi:hypothetical protein